MVGSVGISLSVGFTVLGLDLHSFKLRLLLWDLGRLNSLRRYLHHDFWWDSLQHRDDGTFEEFVSVGTLYVRFK